MAEIQLLSRSKTSRRKVAAPRIDLTPMVDLGFLLITFFMYTTTLAKPAVLELKVLPKNYTGINGPAIPAEATLILLPIEHHQIAWYRAVDNPTQSLARCGFSAFRGLRELLQKEISRVAELPASLSANAHSLHVLIKPGERLSYDDLVRVLDEMQINAVPYYTIMHPDSAEQQALKNFSGDRYGNVAPAGL